MQSPLTAGWSTSVCPYTYTPASERGVTADVGVGPYCTAPGDEGGRRARALPTVGPGQLPVTTREYYVTRYQTLLAAGHTANPPLAGAHGTPVPAHGVALGALPPSRAHAHDSEGRTRSVTSAAGGPGSWPSSHFVFSKYASVALCIIRVHVGNCGSPFGEVSCMQACTC
jgi:hypothetical protein